MISVALAGSTKYTAQCAEAITNSPNCTLTTIVTPVAKPAGRKKVLEENPLAKFAQQTNIPITYISEKITEETKAALEQQPQPDFLLVVDFGYWIPTWMQAWPKVKSLNIHPSALPRWRGSSPGQFVLLNSEKESAVSLIEVISDMDAGDIYWQKPFTVEPAWTQTEYYDHAFSLIASELPNLLEQIHAGELQPTPQPKESPTPVARKLTKADGFVAWDTIERATKTCSPLLSEAANQNQTLFDVLEAATKALSPWPGLWTTIKTAQGVKQMKILTALSTHDAISLNKVRIEGRKTTEWKKVGTSVLYE